MPTQETRDIHRIGGASVENLRLKPREATLAVPHVVRLVDESGAVLAIARVSDEGEHYGGTIDLSETPDRLIALFEEFEEVVNGQIFSVLDEVQEKIAALPIKAVFDSGIESNIRDLQIYPETGDVSFKLPASPTSVR